MPESYRLSPGIVRAAFAPPYPVPSNEPENSLSLQVYALDPSISRHEGSVTTIRVPRETRLADGPCSGLFAVDQRDAEAELRYRSLDLVSDARLRSAGGMPDPADAAFHAQMVYGISMLTYETFRKALGRHPSWAFHDEERERRLPLMLHPFGMRKRNAWYSREERAIQFGYYEAEDNGSYPPRSEFQFTSLSSDIITHEVSHALLDGLRPHFREQTHPEVLAFHEAFGDLVALLQRFTFEELIRAQLKRARGNLNVAALLRMIAPQLAGASGDPRALRTFAPALRHVQDNPDERRTTIEKLAIVRMADLTPAERLNPHHLGHILTEAIFDAFQTILGRKLEPLLMLATGGSGVLPEGSPSTALLDHLVHVTHRTAAQFLAICIRAIDYCPPVYIQFGDYLRALITADTLLVKADPHGYREAIIGACTLRGIYPRDVATLSESALNWDPPLRSLCIPGLGLSEMAFLGDPAIPSSIAEVRRQAHALGTQLSRSRALFREVGLHEIDADYDVPEIMSIRSSRRVGPDDQVNFDLVAEVVQMRRVRIGRRNLEVAGGATIVLDPLGQVRFVVRKRVDNEERLEETREFLGESVAAAQAADRRHRPLHDIERDLVQQ